MKYKASTGLKVSLPLKLELLVRNIKIPVSMYKTIQTKACRTMKGADDFETGLRWSSGCWKASLTSVKNEGAECERRVIFLLLLKLAMRLTTEEEFGVVMMGIMASFVMRCAVDWRPPGPRSRYPGGILMEERLLDSSSCPDLGRNGCSIILIVI